MKRILTALLVLPLFTASILAAPSLPTNPPTDTTTSNDTEQISEIEAEVNKCIALYDENQKYYKSTHWECLHKLAIESKDSSICSYNQKVLDLPDSFRGSDVHDQITKCYWNYALHYEDKAAHKQYFDKFILPKCTSEYAISDLEGDNCAFDKLYPSYADRKKIGYCDVFKVVKFQEQCNSDNYNAFTWQYEDCENLVIKSWQKMCYEYTDYSPPSIWGFLLAAMAIVSLVLLILNRNAPLSHKRTILRTTFYIATHISLAILYIPFLIRLNIPSMFAIPLETLILSDWLDNALSIAVTYIALCWLTRKYRWWTQLLIILIPSALYLAWLAILILSLAGAG